MKVLVLAYNTFNTYSGVFSSNFCRALTHSGIEHKLVNPSENLSNYSDYDLFIGAGDELLRRLPEKVAEIKSFDGTVVDIRTKFLPRKPKTWLKRLVENKKYQVDYVLTHTKSFRKDCFYIGHGFNDKFLFPEQDDTLTIFVDHYFPHWRCKVQKILDQCREYYEQNQNVRVWYQNSQGIVENNFKEDTVHYRPIPFDELSAYYRKTHIFLPTHRETQGMVAAEIGMCGGITLLEKWMYPKATLKKVPHQFYTDRIEWPRAIDLEANRRHTQKAYCFENYANRIKVAIEQIVNRK